MSVGERLVGGRGVGAGLQRLRAGPLGPGSQNRGQDTAWDGAGRPCRALSRGVRGRPGVVRAILSVALSVGCDERVCGGSGLPGSRPGGGWCDLAGPDGGGEKWFNAT